MVGKILNELRREFRVKLDTDDPSIRTFNAGNRTMVRPMAYHKSRGRLGHLILMEVKMVTLVHGTEQPCAEPTVMGPR